MLRVFSFVIVPNLCLLLTSTLALSAPRNAENSAIGDDESLAASSNLEERSKQFKPLALHSSMRNKRSYKPVSIQDVADAVSRTIEKRNSDRPQYWDKREDNSFLYNSGYDPWSTKRLDDFSLPNQMDYNLNFGMNKRSINRPSKRSLRYYGKADADDYYKRAPSGMGPKGFHEGIFNNDFGRFYTLKKRGKRSIGDAKGESKAKRSYGMGSSGFHGDTFNEGWGGFETMKKRRPEWDSSGYYGDTFSGGFGDFGTMKKRNPEMTSMGFYGDTFSNGFGDFGTMKKRRPEMTSSGFYGDVFSGGFGDFGTMRKREMNSNGFHGDMFSGDFGNGFSTMKRVPLKRRPEMTSSGFYGDTFSGGFGDFSPMKRSAYDNEQQESDSKGKDFKTGTKIDENDGNTSSKDAPVM